MPLKDRRYGRNITHSVMILRLHAFELGILRVSCGFLIEIT